MSSAPKSLKYTTTHEWVRQDEDELITVGITNHAQCLLGELVYAELPEVDASFDAGEECAVVESVKAAADVYCPVSGEVVEVNQALESSPQLINQDPYGQGWLFKMRPFETKELAELLTAEDYSKQIASEAH